MRNALLASLAIASLATAQELTEEEKGAFDQNQWNQAIPVGNWPGMFSSRRSDQKIPREHEAIINGLEWLKHHQDRDGSWHASESHDIRVAVTSLSALAMLGNGNTMRYGPYKHQLKRAMAWLRNNQKESGAFADATGPHLLAALAMTECYTLSEYRLLKACATKAGNHAASLRRPDGGWAATPDDQRSDPSLTLWGTNLLMTASEFSMIPKENACKGVFDWLRSGQANLAPRRGVLGLEAPPVRLAELAYDQAAANAFTLSFLAIQGANPQEHAAMQEAAATMRKDALIRGRALPRAWIKNPRLKLSIHEWFCTTHALVQAGDQEAVAAINKSLAKHQVATGDEQGSWEPIGVWGEAGGRIWTTAMAVLTLEAPHRFAKIKGR